MKGFMRHVHELLADECEYGALLASERGARGLMGEMRCTTYSRVAPPNTTTCAAVCRELLLRRAWHFGYAGHVDFHAVDTQLAIGKVDAGGELVAVYA